MEPNGSACSWLSLISWWILCLETFRVETADSTVTQVSDSGFGGLSMGLIFIGG